MTTDSLLYLSAILFGIALFGIIIRRNAAVIFMCVELMLNAVNISLVTFSMESGNIDALVMVFFVLILAAAETVIGLSILLMMYRHKNSIEVDAFNVLKSTTES